MTRFHPTLRGRTLSVAVTAVTAALGAAVLVSSGSATADQSGSAVPAPPANPTSADQIQNIDQVRTAIKAYYGDTLDTKTLDPITGAKDLHTFNPAGAYAAEVGTVTAAAQKYLKNPKKDKDYPVPPKQGTKAIVLDVDDTTLNTYNYEIYSNFAYNPTSNQAFVNAAIFPAVPTMPDLVSFAASKGYEVFYLTGRPEAQRQGTVKNLRKAGYAAPNKAHLYLKDLTNPIYSSCAPTCTTIQYKSLTRAYIESRGYNVVANFGDQFSDLTGGFADKTFKLPNPMYYLP